MEILEAQICMCSRQGLKVMPWTNASAFPYAFQKLQNNSFMDILPKMYLRTRKSLIHFRSHLESADLYQCPPKKTPLLATSCFNYRSYLHENYTSCRFLKKKVPIKFWMAAMERRPLPTTKNTSLATS